MRRSSLRTAPPLQTQYASSLNKRLNMSSRSRGRERRPALLSCSNRQPAHNTGGRQMSDNVVTLFPARTPQATRAIDAAPDAVDQATLTEQDREVIIAAVIRRLATQGSHRLVYVAGGHALPGSWRCVRSCYR